MKIERVGDVRCRLGEGPLWDESEQALYFIDGTGQKAWRHDPSASTFESWDLPSAPGSLAIDVNGDVIVAMADGLHRLERGSSKLTELITVDLDTSKSNLNDGKVDQRGRFVVGAVDKTIKNPISAIYSFANGSSKILDTGFICTNGPCWSPDGKTFYISETIGGIVFQYDYDLESGDVTNKRIFARVEDGALLDGSTVDAEGRFWTTSMAKGKILCFAPTGELETEIDLPTLWPSSVMFGGPNLASLYFTSVDPETFKLGTDENGGYLYVIEGLGAKGLAEARADIGL